MTWWFGETPTKYNPSITGSSVIERMWWHNRLYWYISWLVIYFIITLIVYIVFRVRKHEHPLIYALRISWIWWIIIVFVLYNVYMIFVWTCNTCAYFSRQDDPMFKLMLLDIWFIVFMVIALIFYFKGKKNTINNKIE